MKKLKIIRAVTSDISLEFIEPMLPELIKKYDLQLLSSPGEKMNQMCEKYGLIGHRIYMFRRISIFKDIISLFRIIKVFYREKPYMVHSMTPKAGLLCMIAAWLVGVPKRVHTFTGLVWPTSKGLKRRILIFTDRLTCFCATHIIPEGKGVMKDLQMYITKKEMRVLGYGNVKGIDMTRFSRRPEILKKSMELRNDKCFTFLFVGRIVSEKGVNELVLAFDMLNRKYSNTYLYIVGRIESYLDPLNSRTLEIINNNSSIELVGPKCGDELLIYYLASDCFVLPSYREGVPNTVLEAGAMGLPCIVTDVNGSREIIENGVNGVIIPSKDSNALYIAMEQMLLDKVKIKTYVSNARRMIESRYEQSFVCKCLYDFYDEIISK